MAKLKDILSKIATVIGSQELAEIAANETFTTFDVDDEISKSISGKFGGLLTPEAAKNNPEVIEHIKSTLHKPLKKSILGNLDQTILDHAKTTFGEDSIEDLQSIENTGEKLAKFMSMSQDFISRHSKDPKSIEVVNQLKGQIDSLNKDLVKTKSTAETEMQKFKTGIGQQLINTQLKSALQQYQLGPDYTKEDFIKNALFDKVISKVNETAKLSYDWDGNQIQILNPENPDIPLFIENQKVEDVKSIIDPLMKPYIVKQPGRKEAGSDYVPAKPMEKRSALQEDFERKRQEQQI